MIFDERDLEAAKQSGAIDPASFDRLTTFLKSRSDPAASSDTESLRFLANFNDVFISTGIVILAFGLAAASGTLFGSTGSPLIVLLPVIAALWALLEYFAGRRRLLLPSMTLSAMIAFLAAMLTSLMVSGLVDPDSLGQRVLSGGPRLLRDFSLSAALGGGAAALAVFIRFRLPFALFLVAIAAAFCAYTLAASYGNIGLLYGGLSSLVIGLFTLAVAIGFDARDPERAGLSSDNAFWLHLAAAPQIMLGLRGVVTGSGIGPTGADDAGLLILALVCVGLLSVALNRRALIASGLVSFWLALNAVFGLSGVMWTLLLLGGGIVLLGAGWKTARRIVLSFVPKTGLFGRVFPPEPL